MSAAFALVPAFEGSPRTTMIAAGNFFRASAASSGATTNPAQPLSIAAFGSPVSAMARRPTSSSFE